MVVSLNHLVFELKLARNFWSLAEGRGEVLYFIFLCVVCVRSCEGFLSKLCLKIAEKEVLAILKGITFYFFSFEQVK